MKTFFKTAVFALFFMNIPLVPAYASQTYTDARYFYSVDYPDDWKVKHVGKITVIFSPKSSDEDKFPDNVSIVVEDLSELKDLPSLLDYHRQAIGGASSRLADFKLLEESQTRIAGREAIEVRYSATVKNESFLFKDYKVMEGSDIYVMTYTGRPDDFEKFLPMAEKVMHSLQVSP